MSKKRIEVTASPQEFRGRVWCVVNGNLFVYESLRDHPGTWVMQSEFKVTGPNAAAVIHGLYQQHATAFPVYSFAVVPSKDTP